jgi:hypothetical protein
MDFIPATDPRIRYGGRWEFKVDHQAGQQWPGVYLQIRFKGTGIAVRMQDPVSRPFQVSFSAKVIN